MNRKQLILLLFLLVAIPALAQQDIQFSQYVFNGLSVNPAYAGYKGELYGNTTYRQQWNGIQGAPQTAFVTLDGLARKRDENIGIGGQLTWDRLGPQESIALKGAYTYRIPMNYAGTRRLCLGIGVSVTQYSLDGSALVYIDPNDPTMPSVKVSTIVPDADFGIYYYTPNFYAGVSALDLFSLNQQRDIYYSSGNSYSTLRKSPHLYLTMGTMVNLSDNVKLKPSFMIKEDFKSPTSIDLNLLWLLAEKIWVGGSYRFGVSGPAKSGYQPDLQSTAAASAMVEIFATSNMRIGYAYDFTTSQMASYQNGTHELSIGILFPSKTKRETLVSPRYF
jgi:type IX secretion system PorP/SprF family membrane protein